MTLLGLVLIHVVMASVSADEPSKTFTADLIYMDYPIQITAEGGMVPTDWDPRIHIENPFKARIAPRVKSSSSTLEDPVYDVSEYLRNNGAKMPKGSEALFSPRAKLFYISSTEDDVNLVKTFVGTMCGGDLCVFDVRACMKTGKNVETLFEAKAVPAPAPGKHVEFTVTGKKNMRLALAPVVAPDAKSVETDFVVEANAPGKSLKLSSTWTTHIGESAETTLGNLGDSTITLQMKARLETGYWGPGILATEAAKTEAIQEIQQARERDRAGPSP